MSHIFISYSKRDITFARHLKLSLEEAGFVVWMDETAVRPSTRWWPTIERNIENSGAVIVIMSPRSRESDWVERELLYAERLGKHIFPVLLEGDDWPRLANIQYSDMRAGTQATVPVDLLDGLSAIFLPGRSALDGDPRLPPDWDDAVQTARPVPEQPRRAAPRWVGLIGVVAVLAVAAIVLVLIAHRLSGGDHPTPTGTPAPPDTVSLLPIGPTPGAPTSTAAWTAAATEIATDPATATEAPTDAPSSATPSPAATPLSAGANNRVWTPVEQTVRGIPFVYVPAGCFVLGNLYGNSDEQPTHEVCLSAFWIGQTEVTNAQYKQCVDAGTCAPPGGGSYYAGSDYRSHPVASVAWDDAQTFAAWLGGSLPSEVQWEYAARGPSAWNFPWANILPSCERANLLGCLGETAPDGPDERKNGASWVGALDLIGNVWEWCANWYASRYYDTLVDGTLDPAGPSDGLGRAARGGAWDTDPALFWTAFRNYFDPRTRATNVGFRVILPDPLPGSTPE